MSESTSVRGPGAMQAAARIAPAGAAGPVDTARQLAWQREMERAQMDGWFKPPVEGQDREQRASQARQASSPPGSRGGTRGPAPSFMPEGAASDLIQPVGRADASGAGLPVQALGPGLQSLTLAPVGAQPVSPTPSPFQRTAGPVGPAPGIPVHGASEAAPPARPPSDSSPLHLHAESTAGGQAIWIAVRADDDALAAMLPRIVADLRRELRDLGERLHQVVCNGRLVWRDGAMRNESLPFQPKEP